MRFRDHALAALGLGALCYGPEKPRQLGLLLVGGVLIDADHWIVYGLQTGDWSLSGVLRYNRYRHRLARVGDNRPRYGPLRSVAHQPLITLPLGWWLARRWRWLQPLMIGLSLHLLLDHWASPYFFWMRWQAGGQCAECQKQARLHVDQQWFVTPDGKTHSRLRPLCWDCRAKFRGEPPLSE